MLDVKRLDAIVCTTALEVELLAALVHERRITAQLIRESRLEQLKRAASKLRDYQPTPVPVAPKPKRPVPLNAACRSTINQILSEVAHVWGIQADEIISQRRQTYIVEPRQVVCMLAKTLTIRSYPEIGRRMGHRDHSTVFHAAEKYNWLRLQLLDELSREEPLSVWVMRAYEIIQATKQQAQQEGAHDASNQELAEVPALQGPQPTVGETPL